MDQPTATQPHLFRKIVVLVALVAGVLVLGTVGYVYLAGMDRLDAFLQTVITISTVGFDIPADLSDDAKLFTAALIGLGVSIVLYGVSTVTAAIVEGRLNVLFRIRRNRKMVQEMKDHTIVVGGGVTGRYVVQELFNDGQPFVVIDSSEEAISRLHSLLGREIVNVVGDATEEEVLKLAGVLKARALISTLPTDSLNVFVVLSARTMNPRLNIVSKVTAIDAEKKLKYAGANEVVAIHEISGKRMARVATKPETVNFLDIVSFGNLEYRIEEIELLPGSKVSGKTLAGLNLPAEIGLMIIAIRRETDLIFSPTGDTRLEVGDKLMVLGTRAAILKLNDLANPA
ncbi:MAG TPA: potassium channel protein [Thermotogota bacterium]|nr:potassium channel protein [Thermotogota bacterium]HRW92334.1 potassium channel protein [Thermotogota bacterium]